MEQELDAAYEGLFMAAEHGRADVLKALLEHGKDVLDLPRIRNAAGLTPLHVAVIYQKADAVRTLLAAGFPSDATVLPTHVKYAGMTSYQLAMNQAPIRTMVQVFLQYIIQEIALNHVASVEALLRAGIDPLTATDGPPHNNSLLHWAACSNAIDVVELLLRYFGDDDEKRSLLMNRQNTDGATALHDACHGNYIECVKLLVENGADLTVVGVAGYAKDKTAVEVATNKDIMRVIAKGRIKRAPPTPSAVALPQEPAANEVVQASSLASCEVPEATPAAALVDVLHGKPCSVLPPSASSTDPKVLLEEKQALIDELKQTIDELVTDNHDRQLLGEERVVLEFIRKLRDEKQMVERHLHDAEEHIFVQEELMIELKAQIRRHNSIVEGLQKQLDALKREKDPNAVVAVVGDVPAAAAASEANRIREEVDASVDSPAASTMMLEVPPPTSQPSNSFWSSLLYFLWLPFADEEVLPTTMPSAAKAAPAPEPARSDLHETILTV
ncbi:Aste57867_22009 [Aphanomyces stellatus]|uniref:Aste57867_22009 protein n=1 Tax=Aphanomyces stellatus TaxID=120398 RepID=A0A485LJ31_9STRA|nr:hypothetical protein As57867_021940 [Aphanomyces stellatus]VFT98677.1 Aste57867_22009 [Aphanomyces stellatus]